MAFKCSICLLLMIMDVNGCRWCMPTMGAVATQWLIVVCFAFIYQFVADVGCLSHSLSMCCCCSWQDSTWECNVMMQCASHHICITLSGWLLFVIHCCLLLYVVVVVCSWCLLDVVVLVYIVDDGCWWLFLLLSVTVYFVTNCGKLHTFHISFLALMTNFQVQYQVMICRQLQR